MAAYHRLFQMIAVVSALGACSLALVLSGGAGVAATYYINATCVPSPSKRNDRFYIQQSPGVGIGGIVEPVWPTRIGDTVRDGDITWICAGITRRGWHVD